MCVLLQLGVLLRFLSKIQEVYALDSFTNTGGPQHVMLPLGVNENFLAVIYV